MAQQRIKGQEVEVQLVVDGAVQDSLTAIQNFSVSREFSTTEEGYLSEKANRYDEYYNGFSGSMDLHFSSPDVFDLMQSIQDRAQRRDPGVQINIKATLNFPSGERRRVLLQDCFFDSIPMNFGSRGDYGSVSLNFKGSDVRVI